MPPSRRRRPKDRKATIALAAAELFCVRGFHNVGIDDIAEAVGITGPAIYRHFPTKQAVLAAAVEELGDSFAETVAAAAGGEDPAERLQAAVRALVRHTLDRRSVARLYQWEGRHLPAEQRARLAERFDATVRTLRDMLLDARPELSRQDAATLMAAALSVIASPSTHRASLARAAAEHTVGACVRALLTADLPAPRRGRPGDPGPERLGLLPRRERLLAEAVRLFHERGYHAVSIADIGEAAGINASSVYTHFSSKAELLAAAYYRATSRLELATAAALVEAGTPAQALRRLVETYVRITFEQSDLAAVYVSESENLPATDRHHLRVAQRRHVDTWVGLVAEPGGGEPPAAIRFRVHAALNVVTDLARSSGRSVTEERTAALVLRLLEPPADD
ncbi:AcrR family transcriptional regulator [Streptosporangium becharense]|uniref:AcrR family transcriptional regulator n=1 Tax=Streptosporangium becharense TaxID=1816182 RepID=A0A7W9INJ4_9ACTN|nr:TetR/AcrR family transcriptional regulator [Streptosporangium becharense]MBB2914558.1 AcrR family transcriptional regulator [Streptosporangium becharense]MBB5823403.1 AcrR family transcriptional regulator [Streptosporangium becharense]